MFDAKAELLDKIRLGESSFLEFAEMRLAAGQISGLHPNSLADGLAAFANCQGGVFVLGVSDQAHEVVGVPLERVDAVVEFVRNVCMDSIEPPLEQATVDRLLLPSADGVEVAVVKVDVPRSPFVHRSPGGYLHRVADSKRSFRRTARRSSAESRRSSCSTTPNFGLQSTRPRSMPHGEVSASSPPGIRNKHA